MSDPQFYELASPTINVSGSTLTVNVPGLTFTPTHIGIKRSSGLVWYTGTFSAPTAGNITASNVSRVTGGTSIASNDATSVSNMYLVRADGAAYDIVEVGVVRCVSSNATKKLELDSYSDVTPRLYRIALNKLYTPVSVRPIVSLTSVDSSGANTWNQTGQVVTFSTTDPDLLTCDVGISSGPSSPPGAAPSRTYYALLVAKKDIATSLVRLEPANYGELLVANYASGSVQNATNLATSFVTYYEMQFGQQDQEMKSLIFDFVFDFATILNSKTYTWHSYVTSDLAASDSNTVRIRNRVADLQSVSVNYQKKVVSSQTYSQALYNGYTQLYTNITTLQASNADIQRHITLIANEMKGKHTRLIITIIMLATGILMTFFAFLLQASNHKLYVGLVSTILVIGAVFLVLTVFKVHI